MEMQMSLLPPTKLRTRKSNDREMERLEQLISDALKYSRDRVVDPWFIEIAA